MQHKTYWASVTLAAALGTCLAAPQAMAEETPYDATGRWRIMAISQDGNFHYCAADIDNNAVTLRIATEGRNWQLGVPFYDEGPVRGQWGFDGWEDEAMFRTDGDGWAVMDVTPHILESLRVSGSFSIELDRGPQTWTLKGSAAALDKAQECARNQGQKQAAGRQNDGIGWVRGRAGQPPDRRSVAAGTMSDGLPAFVCIAKINGGAHPGMAGVWIDGCSTGYGGQEVVSRDFDMMTGTGHWVAARNGRLPPNAVEGGYEADGRPLYICRAEYPGGTFMGKTRPGFEGCNIGADGQEISIRVYDVLTP